MSYSALTNTVLIVDVPNDLIFESDLNGNLVRTFQAPFDLDLVAVTRGPNGDVFATDGFQRIERWSAAGAFLGSTSTAGSLGLPNGIVWAGNAPEPGIGAVALAFVSALGARRRKRPRA
jgi:MYXO-CTERM domain-containing protein